VSLFKPFRRTSDQQELLSLSLHHRDTIRLKASLNRQDKYRNPGGSQLAQYLERKGYFAIGVIKSPILVVQRRTGFRPTDWLYAWRQVLEREIDARFSAETSGVLNATLTGNRYNLSKPTAERFREGGTFHVLVISGVHITFIGAAVLLLVRRLSRKRVLQFTVPVLIVWSYSLAVGADSSVIRSALMFTFVALGQMVFRSASSLNALGAAAFVTLVRDPEQLFDPSWQLTFLSVLSIVAIAWPLMSRLAEIGQWRPVAATPYPPICARWVKDLSDSLFWSEVGFRKHLATTPHRYHLFKCPIAATLERFYLQRIIRYVFATCVVSVAVAYLLLPFQIVYFHRLSLAGFFLNIVVGFLLALLAVIALVAILLAQVSTVLALPLVKVAEVVSSLMIHSVDPFSSLGLGSLRLPEYSGRFWWVYVIYFVPVLWLVMRLDWWRPLSGLRKSRTINVAVALLAHACMTCVLVFHPLSAKHRTGRLQVDFLDVGQGDSALVTMPDGRTLLIDGGGRPRFLSSKGERNEPVDNFETDSRSIGEAVVAEYLWWRGLDHVDYILPTHADADHIDGLNDVLRAFRVRTALVARTPSADGEYAQFSESLKTAGTPLQVIQAGDVINFGGVEVRVLWPPASENPEAASMNNDSVVVVIKKGERSILFTGDIEKSAEQYLVNSGQELKADVVKVPHHGSRTSSTASFVAATKPNWAIISVGRTSMFGHPHAEVVERWQAAGARVLTTGVSGTITVSTDGHDLVVDRFVTGEE
jgi:competence protein ComEC